MAGVATAGDGRARPCSGPSRQPAIGREMPRGSGAGRVVRTAAAVAIWRIGSSSGDIAMRPRAAWRIAWAAGSSGSVSDERHGRVGLLAQRHRERHLAEQRHVELVGQLLAAALAEDREALAARGR